MVNQSSKNKRENNLSSHVGVSVFLAVFSGLLLIGSCNSTPDDIAAITGVEKATVKDTTTTYSDALSFSPSPYNFGSLVAGLGSANKVIVI
ncbi:MAG: hypothetical protein NTV34_10845, partial [Proteobacteria bacterium]|nr:hypothetical protein [Pseudomonadota bacterium]